MATQSHRMNDNHQRRKSRAENDVDCDQNEENRELRNVYDSSQEQDPHHSSDVIIGNVTDMDTNIEEDTEDISQYSCKDSNNKVQKLGHELTTPLNGGSNAPQISSNGGYRTFDQSNRNCDTLPDTQINEKLTLYTDDDIQYSEKTPLLNSGKDSIGTIDETKTQSKCRRTCASVLIIISLVLSGTNIGIHSSILGPALPDLALLTNSTIPEVSIIIAGNGAAFIFGSVVAGILLEFIDGFFVVAAGFLLQGLALLVAFTFTDLLTLTSIYSVAQFFATLGMAGISILCFSFPRRQAQILLQIVFMMMSVGKTIAPFIVSPFIAPDIFDATRNGTAYGKPFLLAPDKKADVINKVHVTHISKAYVIVAMFSVSLSVLNLAIFFVRGEKCIDWTRKTYYKQNKTVAMVNLSNRRRMVMLGLMALMMCLESGLEATETGLLTSYFSEYLHLGKQTGVNAAAFYQGIKIFFSLLVLVILRFIHPATLLLIDMFCILFGSIGLTVAVWQNLGIQVLWVTVAFISAGFSNYLATQVSWLEIRQPIEGKLAPLFSLALGLGGLSIPPMTTQMLTLYGPLSYPIVFTCVTCLVIILYIVTKIVVKESACPSNKDLYKSYEPDDVLIGPAEDSALSDEATKEQNITLNTSLENNKQSVH